MQDIFTIAGRDPDKEPLTALEMAIFAAHLERLQQEEYGNSEEK